MKKNISLLVALLLMLLSCVTFAQIRPEFQENSIVAYFSPKSHGKSTTEHQPQINGYYRIYLRKNKKGYLVQDFYENTKTKQTDPFYLHDKNDITLSSSKSVFGKVMEYFPNGQLQSIFTFNETSKLIKAKSFDNNGSLRFQLELVPETGIEFQSLWYANQQKAIELKLLGNDILSGYGNREDGVKIPDKFCFVEKKLDSNFSTDQCVRILITQYMEIEKLIEQQSQFE